MMRYGSAEEEGLSAARGAKLATKFAVNFGATGFWGGQEQKLGVARSFRFRTLGHLGVVRPLLHAARTP